MPARILAVLGIAVVLAFYIEVLAHAPATGQDFRLFYAAATVLRHGGDPYDQRQLYRAEARLYRPVTAAQRSLLQGNPLPEGPPLVLALRPLVGLLPTTAYRLYAAFLATAAAAAVALLALLWPARHGLRRAVLGLISPVVFLGVMLGQPDALFLLAFTLALWLLGRGRAAPAGALLAIGLIKPQIIAGPIVLLAALAWRRGRLGAYAGGLLAGLLAFAGAGLAFAGPAVTEGWLRELAGFGQTTLYAQVDISSLTTLYVGWAPHALATALSVAALPAWAAIIVWLWPGPADGTGERWWLAMTLSLWLLVTPYAHPHDDIMLLPAAWYLLDAGPYRGKLRRLAALTFAAWWLLPMTSVLGLRPPLLRGLGIVPVLLVVALLALRRPPAGLPRVVEQAGATDDLAPVVALRAPERRAG